MVEAVLALPLPASARLLDVGTGSGCLAVTLARERPLDRLVATDLSEAALAVARRNAVRHEVAERIEFRRGDLFGALDRGEAGSGFDVIASNPPYVAESELPGLEPEVRDHEPRLALVCGDGGLAVVKRLVEGAPGRLAPGGHLVIEIGAGQAAAARALLGRSPGLELLRIVPDLASLPRVVVARAR